MTYEPVANKLSIRPTLCPATGIANQALYIELKFEAWFENVDGLPSNFKASNAFTTFVIIIADPKACKGFFLLPKSFNSLSYTSGIRSRVCQHGHTSLSYSRAIPVLAL